MREILFRAKDYHTGQWVYGIYFKNPVSRFNEGAYYPQIIPEIHGVHDTIERCSIVEDTLGQFTGLTDKNGVKIFEGDIVSYFGKDFLNSLVTFDKGSFWFEFLSEYTRKIRDQKRDLIFSSVSICGEVIGNIYDNPELLEGANKHD